MSEDELELYRAAVHEFYEVYEPLRKKYNLRYHSRFSIYDDGYIEIWQYEGDVKKRLICKVKESDDAEVYKRAAELMRSFGKSQKEREQATYGKRTE